MSKKGDVHVDWIISMGIFIISTILLFVFLKPGAVPPEDKTPILNHLINKFEANFTWEVKKIPLFVDECHKYPSGNPPTDTGVKLDFTIEGEDWDISRVVYSSDIDTDEIWDSNFPIPIDCSVGVMGGCGDEENIPDNCFYIQGGDDAVFYFTFLSQSPESEKPVVEAECDGNPPIGACNFRLGGIETIGGFNKDWLIDTIGPVYLGYGKDNFYNINNIKDNWGIPNSTEFWINSSELNLNYRTASPYQQADIKVKQIKTFTLDKKGVKTPVTINIRVW